MGVFVVLFSAIQAQDNGIHFEHNSSWKTVLSKAKAENKYILVDCFTTWCGPCRYMSSTIFPKEEVGTFFNDKFINVEFQLDTTVKDAEDIKALYADAAFISKQYNIVAYPTFLFFSPDGQIVHREVGGSNADEFIAKGKNALDPEKQYYTQVEKYESGNRDAAFLKNLTLLTINCLDETLRAKYAKDYLSTQGNFFSNDNLLFIYQSTKSTTDTGFNLMMKNIKKFESVVDKKELLYTLKMIIIPSEFLQADNKGDWTTKQWNSYANGLKKKYVFLAEDILFRVKIITYRNKNDWNTFAEVVTKYASSQSHRADELNEYAWTIFGKSSDKRILEEALVWSKIAFTDQEKIEPGYIDTYANLLYKIGRKKEALEWEMKAQKIAIEQGADKSWGQDVIDKINKGEKTW